MNDNNMAGSTLTQQATETPIGRYIVVLVVAWSLVVIGLSAWNYGQSQKEVEEVAIREARSNLKKDTAFRLWATSHGRIYIPVSDSYQPDEFLAHMPERDITTPQGRKLSLINPARMIRQLNEDFSSLYGISGRITSLRPLRAENAPDDWERQALERFEQGEREVLAFTQMNGEPHLRLMQPLMVKAGCLLCHGHQGFKVGEVSGGVGVSVPLKPILEHENSERLEDAVRHILLWLLGLIGIAVVTYHLRKQMAVRRQAVDALIDSETRKGAILETALDCVVTVDANGQIIEFNPAAEATFGYTRDEAVGQPLAELLIPPHLREQHNNGFERHKASGECHVIGCRFETEAMRANGEIFPAELTISKVKLGSELLFTGFLRDITEARELSEKLNFQASHDALTGLYNRQAFERHLDDLVHDSEGDAVHHFLMLDLGQFKVVNDSCGHIAGDELLRQLGQKLKEKIRSRDMLARLGGDEFGLLLENCGLDKAREIAETLLEVVQAFRFQWDNKVFSISTSIGLVTLSGELLSHSDVLSAADAACYKAREEGRNRLHVYSPDDQDLDQRRGEMRWVMEISEAFEENRFQLYRQLIQPVEKKTSMAPPVHYEILLRMLDANGGLVSPDSFIPAAERYSLMPTIDRWVVRSTLRWMAAQKSASARNVVYSINLSGQSLTDSMFGEFILTWLQQYGIDPAMVCFEVTETAAITNLTKAAAFMQNLSDAGCRFALDDFGSGMSSFGYLKQLPVDYLKIDGSFVREIVSDRMSYAMVRSINEIGQVMGKRTIAEYAESSEIIVTLEALGVDFIQGYGIARPEPLPANTTD